MRIELRFEKADFHHLIGLQKLKDIEQIRSGAREKIFDKVLAGEIAQVDIEKSVFYEKMEERLKYFKHIQTLLDGTSKYFRYDPKRKTFSLIDADFVIEGVDESKTVYLFIDQREGEESHYCRTYFPKESADYTKNLTRYTLLYKEKRSISTGTSEVLYKKGC